MRANLVLTANIWFWVPCKSGKNTNTQSFPRKKDISVFIFVYGVRKWSSFILLHGLSNFPSTIYWRDCLFSIGYSFPLCWRLVDHRVEGPFLSSLFCSIHLWLFLCQYHAVLVIIALQKSWSLELWCLQLWFSFSTFLWLFRVFSGSIQILGSFIPALWKMTMAFW